MIGVTVMRIKTVIIIAVVVMLTITACSAITQPPCYKNIKVPSNYKNISSFGTVNITCVKSGSVFARVPDISWLKNVQNKR